MRIWKEMGRTRDKSICATPFMILAISIAAAKHRVLLSCTTTVVWREDPLKIAAWWRQIIADCRLICRNIVLGVDVFGSRRVRQSSKRVWSMERWVRQKGVLELSSGKRVLGAGDR